MSQQQRRGAGDSAPSPPDFDPVKRRDRLSSEAIYELARRHDAASIRLAMDIVPNALAPGAFAVARRSFSGEGDTPMGTVIFVNFIEPDDPSSVRSCPSVRRAAARGRKR